VSAPRATTAQPVAGSSRWPAERYQSTNAFSGSSDSLRDRLLDRLGDQLVAGAEVLVEAAVGESGLPHDLGDAGPVGARLAHLRGGDLDDPLVALLFLALAVTHTESLDDGHHPMVLGCRSSSR
jgi:hypothetical protein